MPRDRDNRPNKDEERKEQLADTQLRKKENESTYVKNASASGTGSLGRSDENILADDTDSEERIY